MTDASEPNPPDEPRAGPNRQDPGAAEAAADGEPASRLRRWLGLSASGAAEDTGTKSAQLNGNGHTRDMRLRIAEFEAGTVEDVMIPRADIVAVEVSTPFDDLLKVFAEEAHSRLPVYRETLDDPLGFVHIKDLVAEMAEGRVEQASCDRSPTLLERIHRKMMYVPASMKLPDLLVRMQATRIHLALVVDEYGGTDGLVSLEDLVEEIVGEIEDEHDDEQVILIRRGRQAWEADARMEIEDFEAETGLDASLTDYEDNIDTLGGVAFALAGRVPVRGEILSHPAGFDIEIIEADTRRIRRVRLRTRSGGPQPNGTGDGS